jgi:hypothetical protein
MPNYRRRRRSYVRSPRTLANKPKAIPKASPRTEDPRMRALGLREILAIARLVADILPLLQGGWYDPFG